METQLNDDAMETLNLRMKFQRLNVQIDRICDNLLDIGCPVAEADIDNLLDELMLMGGL